MCQTDGNEHHGDDDGDEHHESGGDALARLHGVAVGQVGGKFVAHTVAQTDVEVVDPDEHRAHGNPDAVLVFAQAVEGDRHEEQGDQPRPSLDEKRQENVFRHQGGALVGAKEFLHVYHKPARWGSRPRRARRATYLMMLTMVAMMAAKEPTAVAMLRRSCKVVLVMAFDGTTISQPGCGFAPWLTLATLPLI